MLVKSPPKGLLFPLKSVFPMLLSRLFATLLKTSLTQKVAGLLSVQGSLLVVTSLLTFVIQIVEGSLSVQGPLLKVPPLLIFEMQMVEGSLSVQGLLLLAGLMKKLPIEGKLFEFPQKNFVSCCC